MPVNGDDGRGSIDFTEVGVVSQGNYSIHFILLPEDQAFCFGFRVIIGDHQKAAVIMLHQTGSQCIGQMSIKGVTERGHQKSHAIGFIGFQPASVIIHTVTQFFNGGFHTFAVALTHGKSVYDFGNRAQCNARFPGNVFHSGLSSLFHIMSHILLKK